MDSFVGWAFKTVREKKKMPENRLLQISDLIDWAPIRKRLDEMFKNKTEKCGRPNCDVIVMFKILILQQWYGLSDLEVERQIADRLSFMEFLGYPDPFPDSRTIWLFRERMAKTGTDKIVWEELQKQLDAKGLKVKRGTIQDATFIEADPGSSKKKHVATKLKLVAAEMVHGQRKEMKSILATNFTRKPIWITA